MVRWKEPAKAEAEGEHVFQRMICLAACCEDVCHVPGQCHLDATGVALEEIDRLTQHTGPEETGAPTSVAIPAPAADGQKNGCLCARGSDVQPSGKDPVMICRLNPEFRVLRSDTHSLVAHSQLLEAGSPVACGDAAE